MGLTAAGLTAGAWAYAALWPQSQLFGPVLIAGRNPNKAALTFDDGPNGDTTLRLLDVLARHEARATFFLIGRFVRKQPGIVQSIARAGHIIGNHTMTHPWLPTLPATKIREELANCNAALEDTLSIPIRLFRPPHGARRPYVLQQARELGLTTVNWNIIAQDWQPKTPEAIAKKSSEPPPAIKAATAPPISSSTTEATTPSANPASPPSKRSTRSSPPSPPSASTS